MAVYARRPDDGGYLSGPWVDVETGVPCPDSVRIDVSELAVGDIVLVYDCQADLMRSVAVAQIGPATRNRYGKKRRKVTTVDDKGKIDVIELGGLLRPRALWRQRSREVIDPDSIGKEL
jgi:hypothetical protein